MTRGRKALYPDEGRLSSVTVALRKSTHDRLARQALARGVSVSRVAREKLEQA